MKEFIISSILIISLQSFTYSQINEKDVSSGLVNISVPTNGKQNRLSLTLESIKHSIGSARVVMLGEQDHGDGQSLLVKAAIVKYLVDTLGFNVLAFEADFYHLNNIDSKFLTDRKTATEEFRNYLYTIWRNSDQMEDLFHFISDRTALHVTGFDSRHPFKKSVDNYLLKIDSVITASGYLKKSRQGYEEFKHLISKLVTLEYEMKPTKNQETLFYTHLDSIINVMERFQGPTNNFWLQEMKSLRGNARSVWSFKKSESESVSLRDNQMGDNLVWLATEKYKGQKIIVWAANYHIAKNVKNVPKQKYLDPANRITTGGVVSEKLKDEVYSIAVISGKGQYADIHDMKTLRDVREYPGSLEAFLNTTNLDFAFLPLKNISNECQPYLMGGFGHYPYKACWEKHFDSVLFIRTMTPSTYVD